MVAGTKSFSCLTVSKRTGWEDIAKKSLLSQTRQDFMYIVVHELPAKQARTMAIKNHGPIYIQAPEKLRLSNLNASLNAGLQQVTTDYVIFYQDFIRLPKDCFEKLLNLVDEKTFVTTCTPNYDGSDDGRYTGIGMPRNCRPEEWETNVAIAPMKILRQLGGFWPELDNGWSWDNVDLAKRAAMLGCKFILDESNRPKLYPHEQTDKEILPLNRERCDKHIQDIRTGRLPINVVALIP